MPQFTEIVRSISPEKFVEIFSASARKSRETYLHRHDIKKPKSKKTSLKSNKSEARALGLYEALKQKEDEEMVEEILRTWLLNRRELLAAALDHLGIEHDNGLTESDDVEKIAELSADDVKKLSAALEGHGSKEDVLVYLRFMGSEVAV